MAKINRRIFLRQASLASIALAPAYNSLSQVLNVAPEQARLLIDHGFRLTDAYSLLNLELYFINASIKGGFLVKKKLFTRYSQDETYMIVRLPQQHIAEQSFDLKGKDHPIETVQAITRISGYSYLVFRVIFAADVGTVKIPLTPAALMDWNNTSGNERFHFKLVIKQNLSQSLFELQVKSLFGKTARFENTYPLGYRHGKTGDKQTWTYDYNAIPKVYGDPVTALELPWRMILSPKLPDQDRYLFEWIFSGKVDKRGKGKNKFKNVELWTATLKLKKNVAFEETLRLRALRAPDQQAHEVGITETVPDDLHQLEMMLMGSPDYPIAETASDKAFTKYREIANPTHEITELEFEALSSAQQAKFETFRTILPNSNDRQQLIQLYIIYNLVARTDKLMLSPLGASSFLELKNSMIDVTIEKSSNNLFSWKHLLSYGRDEEVEVVNLIMDREMGHKYLHLRTAKRRTLRGTSYIDYREYIMPLDIIMDYSDHSTYILPGMNASERGAIVSKFNAPFQSLEIKDLKPKRIVPLASTHKKEITFDVVNPKPKEKTQDSFFVYYPLAIDSLEPVTFEYEGIDWQGKKTTFVKKIQAMQLKSLVTGTESVLNTVNSFFDGKLAEVQKFTDQVDATLIKLQQAADNSPIVSQLNTLRGEFQSLELLTSEDLWKKLVSRSSLLAGDLQTIAAGNLRNLSTQFDAALATVQTEIENGSGPLRDKFKRELAGVERFVKQYNDIITQPAKYLEMFKVLKADTTLTVTNIVQQINEQFRSMVDVKKADIRNQISMAQQKVAFTVKNLEQELETLKEDTISNLQTEYLLFRGKLRQGEADILDFFNRHPSVPQLQRAQVYVDSLNKIVSDVVPVTFAYAQDYLQAQVDVARLEVEKNASKVFAEVTRTSQEFLKGQLRKVGAAMGGYINPELPVEYLTYLKDPKKIEQTVLNELKDAVPDELKNTFNELKEGYDDLVFLSNQAKESWKKVRQIGPAEFFDGLKATIMGDIALKDILGLNFEMPRMSIVKDSKGLPEKATYTFLTDKIRERDLSAVRFYPRNKGKKAKFQIYLEKGIKQGEQFYSFTRLSDFSIGIKQFGPELLTIFFSKLEASAGSGRKRNIDVRIADVKFGGPLDFVGKIAESLHIPGTGLRIVPSATQLDVGYMYTLPSIETPSFNLANLKFDVGLVIPFQPSDKPGESRAMETVFSINSENDKFLVSAGIFGGRGYFQLAATPRKVTSIDASIEFGGYFGLNLGIAKGYVFLFAGIRFQKSDTDGVALSAYIICSGGVTVFGFISVSVTFLLLMRYNISTNELFGTASVRYSIKIGFFKKSFTLRFSKTMQGTKGKKIDPNTEQASLGTFLHEEVYYVSANESPFLIPDAQAPEPGSGDKTKFNDIHTRESWGAYYQSFIRN